MRGIVHRANVAAWFTGNQRWAGWPSAKVSSVGVSKKDLALYGSQVHHKNHSLLFKVGLITRYGQRPNAQPTRVSRCLELAQKLHGLRQSSGKGQDKINEKFTCNQMQACPDPQFPEEWTPSKVTTWFFLLPCSTYSPRNQSGGFDVPKLRKGPRPKVFHRQDQLRKYPHMQSASIPSGEQIMCTQSCSCTHIVSW